MAQQGLLRVALLVPIFLFSLCIHEFAHAWMANRKGDPTAKLLGRLTLSPFAHADLIGTILLPVFCIYYGAPFFGWAKPVPVDMRQLKNGRKDMALVAFAGPLSNIFLSLVATLILKLLLHFPSDHPTLETVQIFTVVSIQVNLMLAFFNLLPIPPLDGSNILGGVLPPRIAVRFARLGRIAPALLLVLLFTGGFRWLSMPVMIIYRHLLQFAGAL